MVAPEQDRAALAQRADHAAGLCFHRGDYIRAAGLIRLAADLDPSRAGTWASRQDQIREHANREPLAIQTATRLAAAGLTPDDPGLQAITGWNARQRQAEAEREAS
jgi:hypothetical protein